MTKLLITAGIAILPLFTGCQNRLTDFTVISTKNVDFSALARAKRAGSRVTGEDVAHIIIFVPTGVPNLKEAIDRALETVPGAVALVDGVVYSRAFYIPYLYGQTAYIVEGTPLVVGNTAAVKGAPSGNYIIAKYDSKNNKVQSERVSKEKFTEVASSMKLSTR